MQKVFILSTLKQVNINEVWCFIYKCDTVLTVIILNHDTMLIITKKLYIACILKHGKECILKYDTVLKVYILKHDTGCILLYDPMLIVCILKHDTVLIAYILKYNTALIVCILKHEDAY